MSIATWLKSLARTARPGNPAVDTGSRAERLAADWLERERAFRIVTRNWRNPGERRQEIDLVGRDRDVLVFIEVKARSADALVRGYYAVNRRKKRVLLQVTNAYLAGMSPKPRTFRFDVVEVLIPPTSPGETSSAFPESVAAMAALPASQRPEIRHFENVPLFGKHTRYS